MASNLVPEHRYEGGHPSRHMVMLGIVKAKARIGWRPVNQRLNKLLFHQGFASHPFCVAIRSATGWLLFGRI